jgi:tetratricopeptide (TPR) repeat protein
MGRHFCCEAVDSQIVFCHAFNREPMVEGLSHLQEGVRLAVGSNDAWQIARAYNNLGGAYMFAGDLRRCSEIWNEGWAAIERFGDLSVTAYLRWERIYERAWTGHWDDALALADEVITKGSPVAHVGWAHEQRGRIRLARGDTAGALEDADHAVALARRMKDPQALQPALSFSSFVRMEAGQPQAASRLVDELLSLDPVGVGMHVSHSVSPVFDLAWVLVDLGRESEFLDRAASIERPTRWLEGALAIARGRLDLAADVYSEIGNLANEALCRLRATEQLAAEGRRAEADEQLRKALSFWRSVGATRYVQEGEALLAKTA